MVDYICTVDIRIGVMGLIRKGDKVVLEQIVTSFVVGDGSSAVIRLDGAQKRTEIAIDVFLCGFVKD